MANQNTPPRKLPRGFVTILEEECKGCALCLDVCPQSALCLSNNLNPKGHRYVEQPDLEVCTGCSLCYLQCPSSAIVVYRLAKPKREASGRGRG